MIRIVQVHQPDADGPSARYLIERRWPRGATPQAVALTGWAPGAAPGEDLIRWSSNNRPRGAHWSIGQRAREQRLSRDATVPNEYR